MGKIGKALLRLRGLIVRPFLCFVKTWRGVFIYKVLDGGQVGTDLPCPFCQVSRPPENCTGCPIYPTSWLLPCLLFWREVPRKERVRIAVAVLRKTKDWDDVLAIQKIILGELDKVNRERFLGGSTELPHNIKGH